MSEVSNIFTGEVKVYKPYLSEFNRLINHAYNVFSTTISFWHPISNDQFKAYITYCFKVYCIINTHELRVPNTIFDLSCEDILDSNIPLSTKEFLMEFSTHAVVVVNKLLNNYRRYNIPSHSIEGES